MNKPHKSFSVDECKIQTSILLKSLYSNHVESSHQAAKRYQRLSEFKNFPLSEIIKADIKRKHVFAVIAAVSLLISEASGKEDYYLIREYFKASILLLILYCT